MIPALKKVDFIRYGVMHRNTFIDSPRLLNQDFSMRNNKKIFFAGQITGVEGYMESACSGLIAGINAVMRFKGKDSIILPRTTMIGALSYYISDESVFNFQPMGANFGIIPETEPHIKDKRQRYEALARRSIDEISKILDRKNIIRGLNYEDYC